MDQQQAITFLSDGHAYGNAGAAVDRYETHGAIVFLVGNDAYKIKRDVRYDYMDFSTLEQRHAALEKELRINRAAAPEIYVDLVAIVRGADGQLAFGGSGEVVEWALHMRRFAQSDLMSAVIARGQLTPALVRALADAVRHSHRAAPPVTDPTADRRMLRIIDQLGTGLAEVDHELRPFDHRLFLEAAHRHLSAVAACLRDRGSNGRFARCHGDLHLNNIVLWRGVPTLFDALEFDDDLATIDMLYDLAFLLMDLDHRGRRDAANAVLNRYLAPPTEPIDIAGLAALPLFLATRTAIRSLVTAQRARLMPALSPARQTDLVEARRSAADAMTYLSPPKARLVAVGGLSGTGKSTLGAGLAPLIGPAPGAIHIRTDVERKALLGVGETERLPADTYTKANAERVYRLIAEKAAAVLAAGHSAAVDGVFQTAAERDAIARVAKELGVRFDGLWLQASSETLTRRIEARRNDASDATAEVVARQMGRGVEGTLDWHVIDAEGDPQLTLSRARLVLNPDRPPP